jgi:hypothetical protein
VRNRDIAYQMTGFAWGIAWPAGFTATTIQRRRDQSSVLAAFNILGYATARMLITQTRQAFKNYIERSPDPNRDFCRNS